MKPRRLLVPLAAVVLIAVFVLLFTDLVAVDLVSFLPKIRLQSSETRSSSEVTLESVRDLYEFNTVEYVHRAVFPYDYLPEGVSLTEILAKLRTAESTVKNALSPKEYLYFRTYNLATEVGIDLRGRPEFVVVTIVVTAGFKLSEAWLKSEPDAVGGGEAVSGFRVETISMPDGDRRRAIVTPPPAAITGIRIEDIDREDYPYPDVALGAESWRRIAEFVEEQVVAMPEMINLLKIAGSNGQEFVREVLLQAGYDEVVFEQP